MLFTANFMQNRVDAYKKTLGISQALQKVTLVCIYDVSSWFKWCISPPNSS